MDREIGSTGLSAAGPWGWAGFSIETSTPIRPRATGLDGGPAAHYSPDQSVSTGYPARRLALWGCNVTNTYYWTAADHVYDTLLRYTGNAGDLWLHPELAVLILWFPITTTQVALGAGDMQHDEIM
jgi:hypothetical protein